MGAQALVFVVLAIAMLLFILEQWRYDLVALMALLVLALTGLIPRDQVFSGFSNPAVITVAAILVVSQGLASSGVVDRLAARLEAFANTTTSLVLALTLTVAVCSAFMNNVGALALLMPVAIRLGQDHDISPSLLLMPLAFGSLLGGMTTLIGTPPNILIGSYRAEVAGSGFRLFDFAPVGLGVGLAGVLFLALVGWRILPRRESKDTTGKLFEIADYTIELEIPEDSELAGSTLREIRESTDADFLVLAIEGPERRRLAPNGLSTPQAGEHLIVEVDPEDLDSVLEATGFRLVGEASPDESDIRSEEVALVEAVVLPRSPLEGKTVEEARMRSVYRLNLLGVARRGARIHQALKRIRFAPADVLLVQGRRDTIQQTLRELGTLPLTPRSLDRGRSRRLWLALGIFAVAVLSLVFQLVTADVAFAAAALAMLLTGIVSLRDAYASVDWPIIVLLGAMIPVGGALETSGGAATIASLLTSVADGLPIWAALTLVMVLAMFLSDLVNNAATAVLMAPIAVGVASQLDASADPFLMAVAVGASCAFLTPIGHQSNTLVMGPAGYRFGDYWRIGLPLEVLIVLVAVPLLLWVWPP